MEVTSEQLNILAKALKDIVMTKGCPSWVEEKIRKAMKEAKEYQPKQTVEYVNNSIIEVGCHAHSTQIGDECEYEIIEEMDPIQGIRLFNVRIIKSNSKNNSIGAIAHNVPETMLVRI